ncbi:chromosome segregation protein SMC [Thermoproteota archaeon]
MTKINRMVMHGFKSFGKRTELVFGNEFNCVLGPNGSGKSNILDALCFVLGKSSAKSMRAEKSSNLIYNGGKTKKPAKFAEVSIYFDNTSDIFPTEDKEVKISRIVKSTGQGVYKINDKTRTRSQILELLSLAKIDPDGYNIILQGDIIRLIDMTNVERRQIIEEISGISVYEDKKQKAMNELDKVEAKLNEAEIVLAERENYLKELKKERNQAQKYKNLETKIKTNKATFIHRQIEQKEAEKEEFDERIGKHQTNLDSINEKIEKLKKEVDEKKKLIEEINNEIEEKGEKEQIALHKEIEELKVEVATARNRIESIKDELAKISNRKTNLKDNINEVDEKIKELEAEKKEVLQQTGVRKKEIGDVEARIKQFKEKHKLDDIENIEQEVDKIDKEAENVQRDMQEVRGKQQELLREKDKLEFQIQAVDEKIAKVLSIEKENAGQIKALKQKKEEFKKSTLELNQLLNRDSQLSQDLSNSRRQLLQANEELSKLNARNASIQEKLGRDIAITKILAQKNSIRGIYGTVSELGEVQSKYSLALEVAAGSRIKSVVVESDAVAARCIDYLKKNQLGIATFLPMNKIRSRPTNPSVPKLLGQKGVHGKAVDLVDFDAKFKKVFDFVFENTIVVEDVSTARRLGIGTAKMVTIEGDITEMSGAMQGGYRKKRAGLGFNEKEVSKAIRLCEKTSAEMGSKIVKLENEKEGAEEKIVRLRELKAHLEGDIITTEKTLHLESGDIDVNKKVKQSLKENLKKAEKEWDTIQNTIGEKNQILTQNRIKRQELRTKITELRNPLLIAELNAFEEKRAELRESIIKLESELNNLNTQTDHHLVPERENILKVIAGHEKEEEAFNTEIKELDVRIKGKDAYLKDKEKKEQAFYAQFKDLFTKRTSMSEEMNKKEARGYSLNEDSRKTEHKINVINLENVKVKAELAGLHEQFKPYDGVPLDNEKSDPQLQREITQFENMVADLGAVNLKALEIYDTAEKEYNDLLDKKGMLHGEKEDVIQLMNEIESKKTVLFMKTFDVIQHNFQRLFGQLSTKGEASLVLENAENPFEGGMEIKVRLTGNKFLDIRSLSGGEKTLTALAFLFSVQEHEPASFYVLDEVDAALDKKNSERLAELIKSYADHAQYVIISHNDNIISEANNLYGVAMNEHGVTDIVSLRI